MTDLAMGSGAAGDGLEAALTGLEIAVIGMSGRFPGARDLDEFWRQLRAGTEAIRTFSDEELLAEGIRPETLADPSYVKAAGMIEDADAFDAELFGYSPREAEVIDPQHRLFLEAAWSALEDAGYDPEQSPGAIGVFASATLNNYLLAIYRSWMVDGAARDLQPQLGNDKDYLATRVSYKLGLGGPSLSIQSACSSSLVAVHLACQSLLAGDCRLALAGGVSVQVPTKAGYFHQPGGIFSPDGKCRAFDAAGQGTVFGSGLGAVVLARLDDALEAGDRILAVIKGSAINNDGSDKVGFTAPGVEGQSRVIRAAHQLAEVSPESIDYIEAHGTATPIGDPIEVEALTAAFRRGTDQRGFCGLGSVKTNVGHLGNAAGMAGMLKTVLALRHGELPPSLHFETPNPHIDLAGSPFFVVDRLRPWPRRGGPRRAGISSFGVGGTNAHVIVEEAPPQTAGSASRPAQLLVLSAHREDGLEELAGRLGRRLLETSEEELPLADVAFSLARGRRRLRYRSFLTAEEGAEARRELGRRLSGDDGRALPRLLEERRRRPVVFLFPGQGGALAGAGVELYHREPVFRRSMDRCFDVLEDLAGEDLRPWLLADPKGGEEAARRLAETRWAQPVLLALEVSTAALMASWGVEPHALLGHSLGEISAATVAGVFALEDALRLVVERGRLVQGLEEGAMLSVSLDEDELAAELAAAGGGLSVAALNGPRMAVVSGPVAAVEALRVQFGERGVPCQRLAASRAFHSPVMDPILEPLRAVVEALPRQRPSRRLLSNVTGTWLSDEQVTDPGYWVEQLRRTVRFGDALGEVLSDPNQVFVEVGPGRDLASLVRRRRRPGEQPPAVVTTLGRAGGAHGEQHRVLTALGELWSQGVEVDWRGFFSAEDRRRVGLPTYPFERRRFWVGTRGGAEAESALRAAPTAGRGQDRSPAGEESWTRVPFWKPAPPLPETPGVETLLVIADRGGLAAAVAEEARRRGRTCLLVEPRFTGDEEVAAGDAGRLTVDAGDAEGWRRVLADAARRGQPEQSLALLDLAPLDVPEAPATVDPSVLATALERGVFSLLALARAVASASQPALARLCRVTRGMQPVAPGEAGNPLLAPLLGAAAVLPWELEGLLSISVDLDPATAPVSGPEALPAVAGRLLDELDGASPERSVIAWRARRRWSRDLEVMPLPEPPEGLPLRERGVYLVTGGLGGLGLEVAKLLARKSRARLVLLGRDGLPEGDARRRWLAGHGSADRTTRRLRAVEELEALGAEVLVVSADVADRRALADALERAEGRFGPIQGVIHAAGVAGGGLAALRDPVEAAKVLRPKVQGSLALVDALGDRELDFLALFSSTLALTGGVGQLDYAAANAFLDGLAHRLRASGRPVVSIAWPGWREVGMAAAAAVGEIDHPLVTHRTVLERGTVVSGRVSAARHWLLAEHRSGGHPVLPGTAVLELARAVFEDAQGPGPVELSEVSFLRPLRLGPEEERPLAVFQGLEAEPARFFVVSGEGPNLELHASGRARRAEAEGPPSRPALEASPAVAGETWPLEDLIARVAAGGVVEWGEHWRVTGRLEVGADVVRATVELPERFAGEVADWTLHPALLDVATACGLALAGGGDHLPAGYEAVRISGPLPARVDVHLSLRRRDEQGVLLDGRLCDLEGRERVSIRGYSLRRLPASAEGLGSAAAVPAVRTVLPAELRNLVERWQQARRGSEDPRRLSPDEGTRLLQRILAAPPAPHVVVVKGELGASAEPTQAAEATPAPAAEGNRYARPDLAVPYEAPRNELEEACAAAFAQALALDRVGIHDNFFELGGHSLLAIQLVSKLGEVLDLELTVETLFDHPTIAELVAAVSETLVSAFDDHDVEAALAELEGLSEEQVAALIADQEGEAGDVHG
ncbi:MAG: SDR family NAD(P)-dependent oxidoreductase [Acidobacteria bacterium]|nr:SDR family NAD(P)-dependent oxidoreductase [Acidobacteriota bacterium]